MNTKSKGFEFECRIDIYTNNSKNIVMQITHEPTGKILKASTGEGYYILKSRLIANLKEIVNARKD